VRRARGIGARTIDTVGLVPATAVRRAKRRMTMPEWNDKDERQYEHVKESAQERGRSENDAEEIAARTVNKQRREEGRTPSSRTSGTGNPNTRLEERTRDELYNRARELDIEGRSSMDKSDLVEAIRDRNRS